MVIWFKVNKIALSDQISVLPDHHFWQLLFNFLNKKIAYNSETNVGFWCNFTLSILVVFLQVE